MAIQDKTLSSYDSVPSDAVRLFRLAWQLENWLRTMVYVELRAAVVDWEGATKKHVNNANKQWPPYSQSTDKQQSHMTTPQEGVLSYLSFGELWKIITDKAHWPLFQSYFPPESNTTARIEEVKTIRNRVAHFRQPHKYDVDRFILFLKDMESGVRRFCSRYTASLDLDNDPVTELLAQAWQTEGYGYELFRPDGGWLYAPPPHTAEPLMRATLSIHKHSSAASGQVDGMIYRIEVKSGKRRSLNAEEFLSDTAPLHSYALHVVVHCDSAISITIPATVGPALVVEIILKYLSAGLNCIGRNRVEDFQALREQWPEYVLWPDHLLAFFRSDVRASIFDLAEASLA